MPALISSKKNKVVYEAVQSYFLIHTFRSIHYSYCTNHELQMITQYAADLPVEYISTASSKSPRLSHPADCYDYPFREHQQQHDSGVLLGLFLKNNG